MQETNNPKGPGKPQDAERNFVDADFKGQNLAGQDFSRADLERAKFQGANLRNVKFRGASLRQAEFCDLSPDDTPSNNATLSLSSFGEADLDGCILPPALREFTQLHNVEEAAKAGATILFTLLAACIFCMLTAGSFTDAALITNSATTAAIPGLGLSLSVRPFLFAAPWLLLGIQGYFWLHLKRYEHLLRSLPATFPDGTSLRDKAYPWLFSSLKSHQRTDESLLQFYQRVIEKVLSFGLAYVLVPLTIWVLWFRALASHTLITEVIMLVLFFSLIPMLLEAFEDPSASRMRSSLQFSRFLRPVCVTLIIVLCLCAFWVGQYLIFSASSGELTVASAYFRESSPTAEPGFRISLLNHVGYFQTADVNDAEVSKKPTSWTGKVGQDESELKAVVGADLSSANLRYMRGFRAFMVNSRAEWSNMSYAVLSGADLRGSNFFHAKLIGADLSNAQLSSSATPTSFYHASLQGADFAGAKLEGADLTNADVSGADFQGSDVTFDQISVARMSLPPKVSKPLIIQLCISSGSVNANLTDGSPSGESHTFNLAKLNEYKELPPKLGPCEAEDR